VSGDQLEVRSGEKKSDIIAWLDHFEANGGVTVTRSAVSYKTQLKIGQDSGTSDGVISYRDGFKINYATDNLLHFENVKQLAGLKLEGAAAIKGSTQGDSHAATFAMSLNGQNVVFEDFQLGAPTTALRYESGHLFFDNLQGLIGASHYTGAVDVDLVKHRVAGKVSANTFDVQDMLSVFSRRFQMPVSFSGTGSLNAVVEGPFKLGELSYDLNVTLFPGMVAGETYDHAEVSLHSDAGHLRVEKAVISKNKSRIVATGTGLPNGDIDINFHGSDFLLEESENISYLGANIAGNLNFDMRLKGFILAPDVRLTGKFTQTYVEEQELPESDFDVNFFKESVSGKTSLAGGKLLADFTFPYVESAPFHLKLNAKDWNYSTLFALIGGGSLLNDYEAGITGTLDLNAERGGFFAATGEGQVDQLYLKRGTLTLSNRGTMTLSMKNGSTTLNNFVLRDHQGSFLEMKGHDFTKEKLNVRLDGSVNMRLLQIFVPFLEDLSGQAHIGVDVAGKIEAPEVLGNANIENGYVKIKGFPHPLQRIQSQVEFSQSKVMINSFNGALAGGTFSGDGTVLLSGLRNIPVNIKAHVDNVSLNVPDKVHTNGSGDLTFSGNWFPYALSGTYHVSGGLMEMELTDGGTSNKLKQSDYLPKVILQSAFEPVVLDVNVILDHPLPVKNSMMEGAVTGQLQVKGPPDQPVLLGKINAEKGMKIIFRDKTFDVQSANVQFNNPREINPELYATAFTRINEYDINILVQGTAKDPIVRLSSMPPLSQPDIVSLIALGIISQSNVLERQTENSQQQATSNVQLGAAVFSNLKPVKDLQQQFGVDFQVSSVYDDTRNTSTQTITLSKKLSERLKASASRLTGETDATAFKLQYSITPNVSAIGSYENRQVQDQSLLQTGQANQYESILGLDLEFKKEFR
jgi:translocation and assembly module TamB